MIQFSITEEPPTTFELNHVQKHLQKERRKQFKISCFSDMFHLLLFAVLYFGHFLSGGACLTAILFGTIAAIFLAATIRPQLHSSDKAIIVVTVAGCAFLTAAILIRFLSQDLGSSVGAGLATASIVVAGATLGRKLKHLLMTIEDLKPFSEDATAKRELILLSSEYPEIAHYREQARQILRPNLTYAELAAMRQWVAENHPCDLPTLS